MIQRLSVCGLFVSVIVTLFGCKPYVIPYTNSGVEVTSYPVYIVNHEWHTGIVIPSEPVFTALPGLQERFQTPYLEFGWGDESFYQADKIGAWHIIQAIFWPTATVMHTVAVPKSADEYFTRSDVVKLCLSEKQLHTLVQFIKSSFYHDENQQLLKLQAGLYGNSQFYRAQGLYFLTNTCNQWTAKGLKSAGLSLTPAFKITAGSIMSYVKTINIEQQALNLSC